MNSGLQGFYGARIIFEIVLCGTVKITNAGPNGLPEIGIRTHRVSLLGCVVTPKIPPPPEVEKLARHDFAV
jgi:hypothetical protein